MRIPMEAGEHEFGQDQRGMGNGKLVVAMMRICT
jgi:hypothetical protein